VLAFLFTLGDLVEPLKEFLGNIVPPLRLPLAVAPQRCVATSPELQKFRQEAEFFQLVQLVLDGSPFFVVDFTEICLVNPLGEAAPSEARRIFNETREQRASQTMWVG